MKHLLLAAACLGAPVISPAQNIDATAQAAQTVVCEDLNAQCTHQFVDGHKYKIYTAPGIVVMTNFASNGKYVRADVTVTNLGATPIDVLPEGFKLHVITPKAKELAEVSPEKILASERHKAGWANALSAFGAGMATQQVTTQTTSNGTVQASSNNGTYANGTYNGNSTSTTSVPDYAAQARANESIAQRRAGLAAMENAVQTTSLRANTVLPQNSVHGFVYFEAEKHGQEFMLEFPVAGTLFKFPFTLVKK